MCDTWLALSVSIGGEKAEDGLQHCHLAVRGLEPQQQTFAFKLFIK